MTLFDMQDKSASTSSRYDFKVFRLEGLMIENNICEVKKRQNFNNQNPNLINLMCCYHVF